MHVIHERTDVPVIKSRWLALWRSPAGQPVWARPVLLAMTAVAGLGYAWDATGNLEIYYAAGVRSMSMSWHNFFFAAFDPAATITLDKLPGAFWLQALSVRLFGVHAWALVAPQVVEGMASVLVLYRVVRRLSGPLAAIVAVGVMVLSPATAALNRGNISDTLMILLLLLAADATVSAVITGRMRSLIWAGVFVGLAFQAKMIEAWLVLPALALAYLLGAHQPHWSRRLARLAITGSVVAAVSLAWMLLVSLWPANSRPYVDGSHTNSIFSQVFVYNGLGRLDQLSPDQLLTQSIGLKLTSSTPGWDRLLTGSLGHDTGWLIPAAVIALAGCLLAGRSGRGLLTTASILWGTWLVVLLAVFSASSTINAYYTAALSPAIAALLGTGGALAWDHRGEPRVRLVTAATVALTCVYTACLLPARGVGVIVGLPEVTIALGVAVIGLLIVVGRATTRQSATPLAAALVAATVVVAPAVASVSVVSNHFGPFDTPFESSAASHVARALGGIATRTQSLLPALERAKGQQPDLMATQTSAVAAPFIYDTGQEVLPIGGFTGTIPAPTLATLQARIARGDFHLVIQSPTVTDPRLIWITQHCLALNTGSRAAPTGVSLATYYCPAR
jgi:4-amino-4-deoxy-L-arabinose transferase-like glycosyltransferase